MASAAVANPSALNSFMGAMNTAKAKWDSSGANEAMSRVTSRIPQGTQEYLSATSKRLFDRRKLRGVTLVFGIGEERPFYVEKSPPLLVARLKHNLQFFLLNYLVFTFALFCISVITSPSTLIGIALLGALWAYVIRQTQTGSLRIANIRISQEQATAGMGIFSALVLFWLLQHVFWFALLSSGFFTTVHAALRDASIHQDGEDQMDMVGEFEGGEQDAFLGQTGV